MPIPIFLDKFTQKIGKKILDLGCGLGEASVFFALAKPKCQSFSENLYKKIMLLKISYFWFPKKVCN